MKFSLAAAALLGHAVPALSKRHDTVVAPGGGALTHSTDMLKGNAQLSSGLAAHHGERKRRGLRHNKRLMRNLARKNMTPCDPTSTDPDIGILSCGADHTCEPSITNTLGGVCTSTSTVTGESHHHEKKFDRDSIRPVKGLLSNLHPSATTTRNECDTALIDIGILDCEEGQYCQDDEASGLGGFCMDSFDSNRRLQGYSLEDTVYYKCDPLYYDCDCTGVDATAGSGVIICSQSDTTLRVQGCEANAVSNIYTYTFAGSSLVEFKDCYQSTTPSLEEICFTYNYAANPTDPPCYTDFNAQRCTSCVEDAYTTTFNCSNVPGGLSGNYFTDMLSIFSTCANSTCTNVCQASFYIPASNFGANVTIGAYTFPCGNVALAAEHRVISDAACATYSTPAQASCCAPLPVSTTVPPTTVAPVDTTTPVDTVPPVDTTPPVDTVVTTPPVVVTNAPTVDTDTTKQSKAPKSSKAPKRRRF